MLIRILDSDPEFAEGFRAYANYFEDLAEEIRRRYGSESVVGGVGAATRALPPLTKIQRRSLSSSERDHLELSLRKSWGTLRRLDREISDDDEYDEEVNAWIPIQAYYATYHAIFALAIASNQNHPNNHAAALKQASGYVIRGVLPAPWNAYCTGCPQTGSEQYCHLNLRESGVNVLSSPRPESSDDRLAMFLRTTRKKELDRKFREARSKGRAPGRSRRNLRAGDKEEIAASTAPTTIFDLLWRIRKKANYEDADAFVLGASSENEARCFGEALVTLVDGTVACLEELIGLFGFERALGPRAVRWGPPESGVTSTESLEAPGGGEPYAYL